MGTHGFVDDVSTDEGVRAIYARVANEVFPDLACSILGSSGDGLSRSQARKKTRTTMGPSTDDEEENRVCTYLISLANCWECI